MSNIRIVKDISAQFFMARFSCLFGVIQCMRAKRLLIWLFAFSLVISIFMGASVPVASQQPETRQDLVTELKNHAAFHAKEGEAKIKEVVDRYLDRQSEIPAAEQLSPLEIEKIYIKEFKQLSPPRTLIERLPQWVVALLSIVGTVIGISLKGKIQKGFEQAWEWLYWRLAGSALFRNVALKRYRQRIIDKHGKLFIPFRPQRPLDMEQIYVALKVTSGSKQISETTVRPEFDALQAVREYRRLMVTGAPGSGKTMLLKYLLLSFAQGTLALSGRPVVVLLELHRLSQPKMPQDQLIQELVQAFGRYGFPGSERFVRQSLKQGQLMLLLDGLDEVNSTVRPAMVQCIKDLLATYPACRAVFTCRTMVYGGEFNPPVSDQILDVMEFSDQQISRFLRVWQAEMPVGRTLEQLLQTLQDRPQIMALARNPLLLTIIAFLYTEVSFELPHSRAQFYEESTRFLLGDWHKDHNTYKANEKLLVLQHLALYNQDYSAADERDRRSLDYSIILKEIHQILPAFDLNAEINAKPILKEIVDRSGLLLRLDGGVRYQFAHLTLQEYFSAQALQNKEAELLERFTKDPGAWREVVKLWCGLSTNSTHLVTQVYEQDEITGFECLADSLNIDESVAEKIIRGFEAHLGRAASDDAIAQAFGTVASNSRPRGQAVFQFLVEILKDSSQIQNCRQGAANALSRTNLPKAASVLSKYYSTANINLREPLIRMGNLAVPALAQVTQDLPSFCQSMADLAVIGTAEAAQSLIPFLWDMNEDRATHAAWNLGNLLNQRIIEESLGNYSLNKEQKGSQEMDWVWSPFVNQKDSDSSISIITGRITHLICKTQAENIPQPVPLLDPRLAIPICGIVALDSTQLPIALTSKGEFLLGQPEEKPELATDILDELGEILGRDRRSQWALLLSSLRPRQQLNLLARLLNSSEYPTPDHWRYLYQPMEYDFKTGWHYRFVLLITQFASMVALLGMMLSLIPAQNIWASGFIGLATLVVMAFWVFLCRGIENSLEPTTFIKFGLKGPLTFIDELRRFLQENLVWGGAEVLAEVLAGDWAVGAWAVALAGVWVVAGAFTVAWFGALAWFGAFAMAVAWAIAWGLALVGAWAVIMSWAVSWAATWAVAVAVMFSLVLAVTLVFGLAMSVNRSFAEVEALSLSLSLFLSMASGFGVGVWGRKAPQKDSKFKFMAVFAFPFFFGFPIIIVFSILAILQLKIVSLPIAILIEFGFFGICTLLWRRGQYLQRRSQNPLHGILDLKS